MSLLELSIIITIAATLAVGYLSWTSPTTITNAEKAIITRDKMTLISEAIETFHKRNGRLPCPAKSMLNANNVNSYNVITDLNRFDFDDEALSITDISGADCPQPMGAVPTRALGLPGSMMFDGWDRKFHYHVNSNFCGSDTVSAQRMALGCTARSYAIEPTDSTGGTPNNYAVGYDTTKDLIVTEKTSTGVAIIAEGTMGAGAAAAYVLLSHGANGYYGYLPSGAQKAAGTNTDEIENGDGDVTYIKRPVVNAALAVNSFDDIVLFRTKSQIDTAIYDITTPLVDKATCVANSGVNVGIGAINLARATIMRDRITAMRIAGAAITGASDIQARTADNSFNATTTNLSVFAVGDSITTTGFANVANNGTFTVVASSATKLVVTGGTLGATETPVGSSISAFINSGDKAVLDMMWALQDVCMVYYSAIEGVDIAIGGTDNIVSWSTVMNTPGLIAVGSKILITGFTNPANNGIFTVSGRTATKILVSENTFDDDDDYPQWWSGDIKERRKITIITKTCPGNVTGDAGGAIYDYVTNSCTCANGSWDGSC